MHDTPVKLHETCIDVLCEVLWSMTSEESKQPQSTASFANLNPVEKMELDDSQDGAIKLRDTFCIPCGLSDDLLCRMNQKNRLTDETLRFFDSSRTTLKHVRLVANRNNNITSDGLQILAEHTLESLTLQKFKDQLHFGQVVESCLNQQSIADLLYLDIRGTFGYSLVDRSDQLSHFKNLRALTVSDTPFDDSCLLRVCKDLTHLESFDISHTKVKDIGPLLLAMDRLRILLMHRPRLRSNNDALDVLVQLHKLQVLDISDKTSAPENPSDQQQQRGRLAVSLVARGSGRNIWKELKILDMSGDQANFDPNDFRSFLTHHSTLEFLGLLMTNACYFDCLSRGIRIAGDANKRQMMTALETYISRDYFCSRSMYLLFGIFQQNDYEPVLTTEERTFCIEQVVRGLEANIDSLSVCMAGTACLYNLCRGNATTGVRPSLLRLIVESSLTAIEHHAKTPQLHKNVWLTLCNDHMLQSGAFDMFRCCTAALGSMVRNSDSSITRMTVAIISILAAKIPTEMTTKLGTNPNYMRFLLLVVAEKSHAQKQWYILNGLDFNNHVGPPNPPPNPDVTMKFTLSALWNLTDESPATCRCLLEQGGLEVVIEVLDVFHDNSIETKVLGLLNNVAEVQDLRPRLLSQSSLDSILRLLKSPKIDVSYFAAGILAHLCADQEWGLVTPTREDCLSALEESISAWVPAATEMVAYRSFKPFFALLAKHNMPAVQLWAVWAIRHVCSKNVDRYVDMFKNEGGKQALETVLASNKDNCCSSHYLQQLIYDVIKDILDLLV